MTNMTNNMKYNMNFHYKVNLMMRKLMTKFFNNFEKLHFWFRQAIFGAKFFFLEKSSCHRQSDMDF